MRRQRFRGVSTKVGIIRKNRITHTLTHTNMNETDVGCHAWPPSVHNEGHSPFCSGSPTVNTIHSHWASFPPPPRALPSICPLFFLSSIFLSSLGQRRTECVDVWARERGRGGGRERADLQDSLETSVGAMLVTPPSTGGGPMCTRALAVPPWASAELHQVGEGEGGGAPRASAPL